MSGRLIKLLAHDGHELAAYLARSQKPSNHGIVLLQEIFGLTSHICRVCDRYAEHGYEVIAPALFDRVERNAVLGYSKPDAAKGRELRSKIAPEKTLMDVRAARDHVAQFGKVATLGYCWGGTVSWSAAAKLDGIHASVCYYPTQIAPFVADRPNVPVLMHFGENDPIATLHDAESIRSAHGALVDIFTYPAGHGFNCDEIPAFHQESARLAEMRTLDFLAIHLN